MQLCRILLNGPLTWNCVRKIYVMHCINFKFIFHHLSVGQEDPARSPEAPQSHTEGQTTPDQSLQTHERGGSTSSRYHESTIIASIERYGCERTGVCRHAQKAARYICTAPRQIG